MKFLRFVRDMGRLALILASCSFWLAVHLTSVAIWRAAAAIAAAGLDRDARAHCARIAHIGWRLRNGEDACLFDRRRNAKAWALRLRASLAHEKKIACAARADGGFGISPARLWMLGI